MITRFSVVSLYLPKRITRARRHTSCPPPTYTHKHTHTPALIHARGPDMLSPKGPCPVVSEQLPPPTNSLIALLAQQKKKPQNLSQLLISTHYLSQLTVKFIKKSLHALFSFFAFIFLGVFLLSIARVVLISLFEHPRLKPGLGCVSGVLYGAWSYLRGSFATHWGPGLGWH